MPNGTYGGVRGRKTKEIGGKLRKSFVFLLLDFSRPAPSPVSVSCRPPSTKSAIFVDELLFCPCHPPNRPFSWTNRPFALAIHAWGLVSGGSERHRRPPPALPAHVCSLLRHPLAGGGMSPHAAPPRFWSGSGHPATSALLGSVSGQKKRFFVPNATELQYLDKNSRYVSQGNPSRF